MYGERARYWKDEKGIIEVYAKKCIGSDFPTLTNLRILYAWRHPTRYDQRRGVFVWGEARKLPIQQRDLFGYDCAVVLSRDKWKELNRLQRHKLVWHELNHFDVPLDEASRPVEDDLGRIKFRLRHHDLNIERFEAEIEKFGPDTEEKIKMRTISKLYRRTKEVVAVADTVAAKHPKRKSGKLVLIPMNPEEKLEKELGI